MELVKLARYRTDHQCVCVLYSVGRSKLHMAYITDHGVVKREAPASEEARMRPVRDGLSQKHGETLRMRKAARFMLDAGKRFGITEAAKQFLDQARTAVAEESLA